IGTAKPAAYAPLFQLRAVNKTVAMRSNRSIILLKCQNILWKWVVDNATRSETERQGTLVWPDQPRQCRSDNRRSSKGLVCFGRARPPAPKSPRVDGVGLSGESARWSILPGGWIFSGSAEEPCACSGSACLRAFCRSNYVSRE